jgi:hypothetical protein
VASTRITLSSGLSDEELKKILSENRTERVLTEMVAKAEDAAIPAADPIPPAAAAAAATAAPPPASPVQEPVARVGEEAIDLDGDPDDPVPELEVESDLSEAEMDALIRGSDEDLSAPGAAPEAAAAPQPAPQPAQPAAPAQAAEPVADAEDLFDAVGTDLQDEADPDEEIELGS